MSYTIRPEEHELRKARDTVEKMLETCKYSLEKNKMLEVSLGAAPTDSADEHGAHGLAINDEAAQFYFNPEIDGWSEDLEKVIMKEYGKSWFYEKTEASGLVWRELLADVTGLMFLKENSDEKRYIENPEDFSDEWEEKKDSLGEQISLDVQEDFSWQLKFLIGEKLLENRDFEDLPDLKKSDIEKAGTEVLR